LQPQTGSKTFLQNFGFTSQVPWFSVLQVPVFFRQYSPARQLEFDKHLAGGGSVVVVVVEVLVLVVVLPQTGQSIVTD